MTMLSSFRWLVFVALFGAAGCMTAPEPKYYTLPTPVPTESVSFEGASVALREIDLPLYARAAQVPHLDRSGAVTLSDDHRWADEPSRAATRALASSLRRALDVPVLVEPWSRSASPSLRVDVSVDRFIGALGGTLELNGEFQLVDLTSRRVMRTETFAITADTAGSSFGRLTEAYSRALAELSDRIVKAITPGV